MSDLTSDAVIVATLRGARTIAVVGASPKPHRASHGVMRFLQGKGYRCGLQPVVHAWVSQSFG